MEIRDIALVLFSEHGVKEVIQNISFVLTPGSHSVVSFL